MKKCTNCGANALDHSKFCQICGNPLGDTPKPAAETEHPSEVEDTVEYEDTVESKDTVEYEVPAEVVEASEAAKVEDDMSVPSERIPTHVDEPRIEYLHANAWENNNVNEQDYMPVAAGAGAVGAGVAGASGVVGTTGSVHEETVREVKPEPEIRTEYVEVSKPITSEAELPEKYRLIRGWGYVGYTLLFSIPVIGFIFLLVFAIGKKKMNRTYFARSFFCFMLLGIIFWAIVFIVLVATGMFTEIVQRVQEFAQILPYMGMMP